MEAPYPCTIMSTSKEMVFSIALPKRSTKPAPLGLSRKAASSAKDVLPVAIDADFPDAAEMSAMRKLRAPKLKKITTSLF